jgi:hypothetical protein
MSKRHKKNEPWTVEELLAKCVANGSCMEWTGTRIPAGYGQLRHKGKLYYTHRMMAYLTQPWFIDLEDAGVIVMHSCDNPPCCNPEHLSLGDKRANALDHHRRGKYRGRD